MLPRLTHQVRKAFIYLLLLAGAVLTTLPLLFMVATALKANVYIIETPPQFIPQPVYDGLLQW